MNHQFQELFQRHRLNPILTANNWPYSAHAVFNPAAVLLPDGMTLLLCRVEDRRGHSHLSVARSANVEAAAHFGRGIDVLNPCRKAPRATSGSSRCKSPGSLRYRTARDMALRRPSTLPPARSQSAGGSQRIRMRISGHCSP